MKKKQNLRWSFLLNLLLCFSLSGCSQEKDQPLGENQNTSSDAYVEEEQKKEGVQAEKSESFSEYGSDTLVWMVSAPFSDEEPGKEYFQSWEENINHLLDEKNAGYRLEIEFYGSPSGAYAENPKPASDALIQRMKDGIQADVITMAGTSYGTGIDSMRSEYYYASEHGLLEPLKEYFLQNNGRELQEQLLQQDIKKAEINGCLYGIYTTLAGIWGVAYPKEYLEKYQITANELSPDIFENTALLEKIAKGEGHPIYQIFLGDIGNRLPYFVEPAISSLGFTEADGFCNVLETEVYRQEYERLYEWKQKGILDIQLEYTGNGLPFAMDVICYSWEKQEAVLQMEGKQIPVVVVPDPKRIQQNVYYGDSEMSIASWSRKKEQAWDFIVRCYTDPEIINAIRYGIEGEDFVLTEGYAEYKKMDGFCYSTAYYTNILKSFPSETEPMDKQIWMEEYYAAGIEKYPYGFRFCPEPVADQIAKVNEVWDDVTGNANKKLVIGTKEEKDFLLMKSAEWDNTRQKMIEKMNQAGMQEIIEEAQRQYQEWREKMGE